LQNSGPEIYSLETLPAKFLKTFTVSLLLPHKQKPASNLINLQAWHKFRTFTWKHHVKLLPAR
jgi:hypothetical protein